MFCSFEKVPRILRLFCRGKVTEFWEDGFREVTRSMGVEVPVGARAVIMLEIFKVCSSHLPIFPSLHTHCPFLLLISMVPHIFPIKSQHHQLQHTKPPSP